MMIFTYRRHVDCVSSIPTRSQDTFIYAIAYDQPRPEATRDPLPPLAKKNSWSRRRLRTRRKLVARVSSRSRSSESGFATERCLVSTRRLFSESASASLYVSLPPRSRIISQSLSREKGRVSSGFAKRRIIRNANLSLVYILSIGPLRGAESLDSRVVCENRLSLQDLMETARWNEYFITAIWVLSRRIECLSRKYMQEINDLFYIHCNNNFFTIFYAI